MQFCGSVSAEVCYSIFLTACLAWIFKNFVQHCFVCRPSDFIVSKDTRIESRTVATSIGNPDPRHWLYRDTSFADPRCLSPDPGSEFFPSGSRIQGQKIPDPGSGSTSKNLSIFQPKKLFLSSRKYDPGCLSRIRILIFYPSRIQESKRHRIPGIRISNTA